MNPLLLEEKSFPFKFVSSKFHLITSSVWIKSREELYMSSLCFFASLIILDLKDGKTKEKKIEGIDIINFLSSTKDESKLILLLRNFVLISDFKFNKMKKIFLDFKLHSSISFNLSLKNKNKIFLCSPFDRVGKKKTYLFSEFFFDSEKKGREYYLILRNFKNDNYNFSLNEKILYVRSPSENYLSVSFFKNFKTKMIKGALKPKDLGVISTNFDDSVLFHKFFSHEMQCTNLKSYKKIKKYKSECLKIIDKIKTYNRLLLWCYENGDFFIARDYFPFSIIHVHNFGEMIFFFDINERFIFVNGSKNKNLVVFKNIFGKNIFIEDLSL